MNVYKYMRDGEPVYLTFNDAGECIDWRGATDLSAAEVIADLVHKLTATELQAESIKSHMKIVSESLAVINDQTAKIRHGLS